MSHDRSACIFEHDGFTYVCNFKDMVFWIMHEDDDVEPISYLELHRLKAGHWAYRPAGSDSLFQQDNDNELIKLLEKNYERYIASIIVGEMVRGSEAAKLRKNRVPKARHRQNS